MKQQSFFTKLSDSFGGTKSHAKRARPLESKLPIHLVLKAKRGGMRNFKTMVVVDQMFERICRKHGVRLFKYANVGNHLHAVIQIPRRDSWSAYIRELSGGIATFMGGDFWAQLPFTRVVRGWKKALKIALQYVELNQLEAAEDITRLEAKVLQRLRKYKFAPIS